MKTILVPIDFSEVSKNALKFAIKIAHPLKGKILLYHTIQPILIANDMGNYVYPDISQEEDTIQLEMDKLIQFTQNQDVEVEKVVHLGQLDYDIKSVVKNDKVDLIITGTSGAKGLEAFFFGTNSMKMLENVDCPVLFIPESAHYHSFKKIMYATDFQYGDIQQLEKICAIAKPFNAQIIVTHINANEKTFVEEEELMDWFAEIGESHLTYKNIQYKLIYNQDVITALNNAIQVLDIDMLCMSTGEKDFFKRILSKSNTKEMAFHSKIPFLAVRLSENNKLN